MRPGFPQDRRTGSRDAFARSLGPLVLLGLLVAPGPLAGASEAPEKGEDWVRVAPPGERFEVWMPSKPEKTVRDTSSFLGDIVDVGYRSLRGQQTFRINRVDMPSVATFFMTDSFLLKNVRDSFLERGSGTQTAYADVEVDGYDGKRLEFVMNQETKKDARAIFLLVEGQLLSFTGIVPHGHPAGDVERFLASVEIRPGD